MSTAKTKRRHPVLKVFGIILLVLIGLIAFILIKAHFTPMVPENYTETVPTGGEIEAKYLKNGKFEVSYFEEKTDEVFKKYEVYYPTELETSNKVYPVVVFANGTGVVGSKYKALFEHLASWGFVVIGNEDSESWSGKSSDMALAYILKENENPNSKFYHKIDLENIGISGHSQGGVAVFNAITEQEHCARYKTAISISPTNEEQAISVKWHYDLTKINIPIFIVAGTKGDFETKMVLPYEKMVSMYEKINPPKARMRRIGCEHGEMLYSADGYVTAWFMWQLQGDSEAAKAFIGDKPEILENELYQDQKIDLNN